MRTITIIGLVLLAATTACGDDDAAPTTAAAYAPAIDPAEFSTDIDHPLFPLAPGTRWVYEGETDEGFERIVVEVTGETREVMGVETVVVRDTASIDGEVVEDTYDWFAQDAAGNVWYFGEDTHEIEDGAPINSDGSWEAGVDGAQPGIVMPAAPQVGDEYRQEFYEGEAEDEAEVLEVDEHVEVPFGSFDGVLVTRDITPLEPDVEEHKYYAPGVGLVLEVGISGGSGRIELVEMTGG